MTLWAPGPELKHLIFGLRCRPLEERVGGRVAVLLQVSLELAMRRHLQLLLVRAWCACSSEMLRAGGHIMLAHKNLEGLILLLLA